MRERGRLERQPDDGMIAGVAAGVARYFGVDVTLVRLAFVAIAIVTGGVAVLGYILAAIVMPKADEPAGVGSLKSGVGDLVSRGRQMVDETRKAIDNNRGARSTAAMDDEPDAAPVRSETKPPGTGGGPIV